MTFNYGPLKSTAERLVDNFGRAATLRQVADSGTAYAPTRTATDTTVRAVDLNLRIGDRAGTSTGQTRRTLYVSTAAGVTPRKRDKIQVGGVWHEIDEVMPLEPGGVVLMWEVLLVG